MIAGKACVRMRVLLPGLLALCSVSAAETGAAPMASEGADTQRYLIEEQRRSELEDMAHQREVQRQRNDARQQDVQDRVHQRRDEMLRNMNRNH